MHSHLKMPVDQLSVDLHFTVPHRRRNTDEGLVVLYSMCSSLGCGFAPLAAIAMDLCVPTCFALFTYKLWSPAYETDAPFVISPSQHSLLPITNNWGVSICYIAYLISLFCCFHWTPADSTDNESNPQDEENRHSSLYYVSFEFRKWALQAMELPKKKKLAKACACKAYGSFSTTCHLFQHYP